MPENISNWQDAIIVAGSSVLSRLAIFIPNLLGAILVLIIGWLAGAWLKFLVSKILGAVKLNALISGTGVDTFLKKAEIGGKVEDILGSTVRWLTIFIFFIAAVNILGLSTVSQVLNNILSYMPKVFSAAIVLLAGVLLAGLVESLVKGAVGSVAVSVSRFLGKLASWIVMIFAALAAISELGIAANFINTLITGTIAMLSLGLGLALGLGSKDIVKDILTEWYSGVRKDLKRE
ncbi:mechanosensitive ion channel family protein [Candidatus Collierbacteria bacterium]|nr:mechanosensitive ion channel family protein [Candidatus Collierbacteria bacterium]